MLQTDKKKINLTVERSFGEMIGAPIQFVFQEFKRLFLTLLKYAGPFLLFALLIVLIFINKLSIGFQNPGNEGIMFLVFIIIAWLSALAGIISLVTVTYCYLSLYASEGKNGFTIKDVGVLFKKYVFRVFAGILLIGLMAVPMFLLAAVPYAGPFLFYGLFIWLSVSFSLYAAAMIRERISFGKAFSRSWRLVNRKWWFTFGIYLVFSIMAAMILYAVMIPMMFGLFGTGLVTQNFDFVSVLMIITAVLIYSCIYVFIITLQHSLIGIQYFNLVARIEGVDLSERISAITAEEDGSYGLKEKSNTDNAQTKAAEKMYGKEYQKKENNSENPDVQEKKNRFTEKDEDIDRFKPKY